MAFNVLKIKALILQKGISQEHLAAQINVTKQTIINYFNGRTRIDVEMIENELKIYPKTNDQLLKKLKELL